MSDPNSAAAYHYLYFPGDAQARAAAAKIEALGMPVELRPSADDVNLLLLARHRWPVPPEKFEAVQQRLEEIANAFEGEYDGWETPADDAPTSTTPDEAE